MSSYNNLKLEIKDGILYIIINRPDKLNALTIETLDELSSAMDYANEQSTVKGVIIKGAGDKAFVAGADISEIAHIHEINARKFSEHGQDIFDKVETCSKPVIAAVQGYALGGGCELAMACHIRVATEDAIFGLPEVSLGIIPAYGGTQRLAHLIGKGKTFELILTGDKISAKEAHTMGLVNHVTTREDLLPTCISILKKIMNKAPLAITQAIECINASFDEEENGFQVEATSFGICCKSEDFKEGTKAFLEKRPPHYQGK